MATHGPPIVGGIGSDLLLSTLGSLQGPSLDKDCESEGTCQYVRFVFSFLGMYFVSQKILAGTSAAQET